LRLLLDEHLSPTMARRLRENDHDVISVAEAELGGSADSDVLDWAVREGRAIVTANAEHFRPLHRAAVERGQQTSGLILLSSRRFVLARAAFGRLIETLDAFLVDHPGDRDLACLEHWL